MADSPMTLSEHLSTQQASLSTEHARNVAAVVGRIGRVAAVIAQELAHAALRDRLGYVGGANVTGDQVKKLDVWGHETMVAALRETGACAALISEEAAEPIEMDGGRHARPRGLRGSGGRLLEPRRQRRGGHDLLAAPVAGARRPRGPPRSGRGTDQIAAGYVMYGPATTLVYTVGQGTHGFTLDPETGEFLLTHPDIRIPRRGKTYGINEGNVHSWHPGQRAFVEHLRTPDKAAGRPYSLRYSGAMVADVHRTLLDGGLFMYPADWSDPAKPKAKLRLLYEVAPMAMLVEQAGGRASTGTERVLDLRRHRIPPARGDHPRQPRGRGAGRGLLPSADLPRSGKDGHDHGIASEGDPELVRERQPGHADQPRPHAEPRTPRRHRASWSSCRWTRASSTARRAASRPNPAGYDPRYHFQLAIDAGCNAYAAPLGFLEAGAAEFAGRDPAHPQAQQPRLAPRREGPAAPR